MAIAEGYFKQLYFVLSPVAIKFCGQNVFIKRLKDLCYLPIPLHTVVTMSGVPLRDRV